MLRISMLRMGMPAMPRPNSKARRIFYTIMGIPTNVQSDKKKGRKQKNRVLSR